MGTTKSNRFSSGDTSGSFSAELRQECYAHRFGTSKVLCHRGELQGLHGNIFSEGWCSTSRFLGPTL